MWEVSLPQWEILEPEPLSPRCVLAQGVHMCDVGNVHCFPINHRLQGPGGLRVVWNFGDVFALCTLGFSALPFHLLF